MTLDKAKKLFEVKEILWSSVIKMFDGVMSECSIVESEITEVEGPMESMDDISAYLQ